jgi:hypothetical protein
MSDTPRSHDTDTGRGLSARRARAARGQVASYIHEIVGPTPGPEPPASSEPTSHPAGVGSDRIDQGDRPQQPDGGL